VFHAGALDQLALVDNADVATQAFGLFQVMGRQNDGGATRIQVAQVGPHGTPDLDIHACRRLIENQQFRFVHQ